MGKQLTYAEKKAKYTLLVRAFLTDIFATSVAGVRIAEVRRLLHSSSVAALTLPILGDLEQGGEIKLLREGDDGVVYPTEAEGSEKEGV